MPYFIFYIQKYDCKSLNNKTDIYRFAKVKRS